MEKQVNKSYKNLLIITLMYHFSFVISIYQKFLLYIVTFWFLYYLYFPRHCDQFMDRELYQF